MKKKKMSEKKTVRGLGTYRLRIMLTNPVPVIEIFLPGPLWIYYFAHAIFVLGVHHTVTVPCIYKHTSLKY